MPSFANKLNQFNLVGLLQGHPFLAALVDNDGDQRVIVYNYKNSTVELSLSPSRLQGVTVPKFGRFVVNMEREEYLVSTEDTKSVVCADFANREIWRFKRRDHISDLGFDPYLRKYFFDNQFRLYLVSCDGAVGPPVCEATGITLSKVSELACGMSCDGTLMVGTAKANMRAWRKAAHTQFNNGAWLCIGNENILCASSGGQAGLVCISNGSYKPLETGGLTLWSELHYLPRNGVFLSVCFLDAKPHFVQVTEGGKITVKDWSPNGIIYSIYEDEGRIIGVMQTLHSQDITHAVL